MKQATAKDLEKLMIDEFANIKDCQGIHSIGIYPLPGVPNWEPNVINFGNADSHICQSALPQIVEKLQSEYDLIDDRA